MTRETMINAECDYVDEKLCGVNDMTFEGWLSYQDQMLRYYNTYQYKSGPYEEEYYPSENESSDEDESSGEDESSDDENHDCVCLSDHTDFNAGTCCCNHLGLKCNGRCHPNGYDRWLDSREPIDH